MIKIFFVEMSTSDDSDGRSPLWLSKSNNPGIYLVPRKFDGHNFFNWSRNVKADSTFSRRRIRPSLGGRPPPRLSFPWHGLLFTFRRPSAQFLVASFVRQIWCSRWLVWSSRWFLAFTWCLSWSAKVVSRWLLQIWSLKFSQLVFHRTKKTEEERKTLPVYRRREQFLKAVASYKLLLVDGGAFSGKVTQFTQYLHESGYTKKGRIGFTQPSDLAVLSMARRVSKEMGAELGQEVGYSTRFEVCTSDKTMIEYLTDKRLLQELIHDRKLTSYSVLIVDRVHQRTVSTDLLLGFLKNLTDFGSDLKVIISGVFPDDAEEIVGYCNYAPRFLIKDKTPSVQKIYMNALVPDYIISAASKILFCLFDFELNHWLLMLVRFFRQELDYMSCD